MIDIDHAKYEATRTLGVVLPASMADAIDEAAIRDEPCSPNRSSLMRRWLIAGLRREAA